MPRRPASLQLAPLSFDVVGLEIWGALAARAARWCCSAATCRDRRGARASYCARERITALWLTAVAVRRAARRAAAVRRRALRCDCSIGGEALSAPHRSSASLAGAATRSCINLYGPTETTTFDAACCRIRRARRRPVPRSDRPADRRTPQVYVLDAQLQPVPIGVPGELYIGGAGVARGYLEPARADRRAVRARSVRERRRARGCTAPATWRAGWPTARSSSSAASTTRSRSAASASSSARSRPALASTRRVATRSSWRARTRPATSGWSPTSCCAQASAVDVGRAARVPRERAARVHGAGARSSCWTRCRSPPNGKVDRKRAARAGRASGQLEPRCVAPRSEHRAARSPRSGARCSASSRSGVDDNFFDLGGHSLLLAQVHARAARDARPASCRSIDAVPVSRRSPRSPRTCGGDATGRGGARRAVRRARRGRRRDGTARRHSAGVAIVGMAGPLPRRRRRRRASGATCATAWSRSRRSPTRSSPRPGVDAPSCCADPSYVQGARRARRRRPVRRRVLRLSARARRSSSIRSSAFPRVRLGGAGGRRLRPERFAGPIGVFAGCEHQHLPAAQHAARNPELLERASGALQAAARQRQGLPGDARLLQAEPARARASPCRPPARPRWSRSIWPARACSTASATWRWPAASRSASPQRSGYLYQEGGILVARRPLPRLRRRRARARSSATASAWWCCKRLADALADGDHDPRGDPRLGDQQRRRGKVGFTAPSVEGQARGDRRRRRRWRASTRETIGYVEAHGTGTPLGDPIEIAALTQAFGAGDGDGRFCAIGSVKTNIGHLDAAAGVAGLIKTVLALEHRQIPPSLHFEHARTRRSTSQRRPFFVNTTLRALGRAADDAAPRRRQLVRHRRHQRARRLEEAPRAARRPVRRGAWQLLLLSAQDATALDTATARSRRPPRDASRAVAGRRRVHAPGRAARSFAHRRAVVCRGRGDAVARAAGVRHGAAWRPRMAGQRAGRGVPVPRPGRAVRRHGARALSRRAVVPRRCRRVLRDAAGRTSACDLRDAALSRWTSSAESAGA